jgi:hypothetical protein
MRRTRTLWVFAVVAATIVIGGALAVGAAHAAGRADVTYPVAGYVGMTTAQTMSLDVANEASTTCNATLELFDMNDKLMKAASVSIPAFNGKFIAYAPSVPKGTRLELRPVLISIADSCTAFHASVSVSDNATDSVRVRIQYTDPGG